MEQLRTLYPAYIYRWMELEGEERGERLGGGIVLIEKQPFRNRIHSKRLDLCSSVLSSPVSSGGDSSCFFFYLEVLDL